MKKNIKIIVGIIVITVIGIGGKMYMDEKRLNEEMIKVVKSEEAKKVFEEGLKNLDLKALTDEGVIQSYEIDMDSIKHNPMGGINVTLNINNKSKLYIFYTLNKNNAGKLIDNGGGNSFELEKLLEVKK